MSNEKLLVIGAGGHAKSCINVIKNQNKFNVCGLIGLDNELGKVVNGIEVIGTENNIVKLSKEIKNAFIGIGQIKDPEIRIHFYDLLKKNNFYLPNILSSIACISEDLIIGESNIVMHHALINSNVVIGNNCIINTKSLIEHDVTIQNNTHISTGAILNGNVTIGSNCFVGSGAVIKEGVKIANNSIISMGSIVKNDSI